MSGGNPLPAEETICVVAAMENELRHALGAIERCEASTIGPWRIWFGRIDERPLVLLLSGVGMANAASALTTLITAVRPRAVLNYGCAGAHTAELAPGDAVIGSSVVAATAWTILPDGNSRYGGFIYDVHGKRRQPESIAADQQLLDAATRAGELATRRHQTSSGPKVLTGAIASGDTWTQYAPRIEQLHAEFGSLCEEMEAAALAQVCAIYNVPFLAIKDISNNELVASSTMGEHWPLLDDYVEHLGETAFAVVRSTLQHLADSVA